MIWRRNKGPSTAGAAADTAREAREEREGWMEWDVCEVKHAAGINHKRMSIVEMEINMGSVFSKWK